MLSKKSKGFGILVAFLFLFSLFYSFPVKADGESNNINLKVEYGFEGKYKMRQNVPLFIEVENKGENLEGELQVKVPNGFGRYSLYCQKINLPKDSNKKLTMGVPIVSTDLEVFISSKDKIIYETKVKVDSGRLTEADKLIGILSEDFNSLSYISKAKISPNNFNKGVEFKLTPVKLTLENLPDNSKALDVLDIIVINNFDTSKLSQNQYAALKEWVEKGKLLIVGAGPSYQKNLSVFKDGFINGDIGNVQKITTKEMSKFSTGSEDSGLSLDVANIKVEKGQVIIKEGNTPIITKLQKNNGTVVVTGFDLGMEPIISWKDNGELWSKLFSTTLSSNINKLDSNMIDGMQYRLRDILNKVPGAKLPNMKVIGIIFAIYVILVGPFTYIVLKKLNKRDLFWITVPSFAIIFSLIIFFTGSSTRFNSEFINKFTMSIIDEDGKTNTESYIGVISPAKKDINIEEPKGIKLNQLIDPENYHRGGSISTSSDKELGFKVLYEGNNTYFQIKDSMPFQANMFSYENNDVTIKGIKSNFVFSEGKIKGSITNDSSMEFYKGYILTPSFIYELGKVKKGENNNIMDSAKEYTSFDDFMMNIYDSSSNQNKTISLQERMEMRNIIAQLEVFLDSVGASGRNGGKLQDNYIVLFSEDSLVEGININGKEPKIYDTNLIAIPAKLDFSKDGIVEYPYGFMRPSMLNQNGQGGFNERDSIIYGNLDIEFAYKVDNNIDVDSIKINEKISQSKYQNNHNFKGEYSIYNFKNGKYEVIDVSKGEIELKDAASYIKDGEIKVYIKSKEDQSKGPSKLPYITVKGRVK